MEESRQSKIEILAGDGKTEDLKDLLGSEFLQSEIDIALSYALAYSQIDTAKLLLSKGADISWGNYDGVYYAVHNNELEGLKFAIMQGVDVNVNNGLFLNTAIITTYNTKDPTLLKYLIMMGANISLLSKETLDAFETGEIKTIINTPLNKLFSA